MSKKRRTRIDAGTEIRRERYERGNKVSASKIDQGEIARGDEEIKAFALCSIILIIHAAAWLTPRLLRTVV